MRRRISCRDKRLAALRCSKKKLRLFSGVGSAKLRASECRMQDDVQIMEGDDIEPCLLYQPDAQRIGREVTAWVQWVLDKRPRSVLRCQLRPDGEKEIDREPIYNNELPS